MALEQWRASTLAALLAGFGFGASVDAGAAEVLVTAEFSPSALEPGRMVFRNTSPRGVYCSWRPEFCSENGSYSIDVPLRWSKVYVRDDDVRKRFYLGLPGPRTVMLRNSSTGAEAEVLLTIATVSGHLTPGSGANPVFTRTVRGAADTWLRQGMQRMCALAGPSPIHRRRCPAIRGEMVLRRRPPPIQ